MAQTLRFFLFFIFLFNLAGEIREGFCHEDGSEAVHQITSSPIHNEHSEPHLCHLGHCGHLVFFEQPLMTVSFRSQDFGTVLVPNAPWRDLTPLVRPPIA